MSASTPDGGISYQDGDLVDEIGQIRRLADALNSLADVLESEAD